MSKISQNCGDFSQNLAPNSNLNETAQNSTQFSQNTAKNHAQDLAQNLAQSKPNSNLRQTAPKTPVSKTTAPERIVIKVGTSTLCYKNGALNLRHFAAFVRALADIRNRGVQLVLVSSGAIGLGVGRLGLGARPSETAMKQACAAVGQSELMRSYADEFAHYNQRVAQLLLTRDVIDHDHRRANVTNALETLLALRTLPIINANDSVSLKHLDFDENDTLSAIVARLVGAQRLVILTDVDGLYDADPATPGAQFVPLVERITPQVRSWCADKGSELASGGMQTKLDALQIATAAGVRGVILNGKNAQNIYDYFDGVARCTEFLPQVLE